MYSMDPRNKEGMCERWGFILSKTGAPKHRECFVEALRRNVREKYGLEASTAAV